MIFTLGTAQLGMPYGAVNDSGQPTEQEAVEIVLAALAQGVTSFDTAREYGRSEAILGCALSQAPRAGVRVITKLGLLNLGRAATQGGVRRRVDESIEQSRRALRSDALDVVLLHRWEHRRAWNGLVWERLLELCDKGHILSLGASVYDPSEALQALCDQDIEHVQIPFNVLDWRWRAAKLDQAIADRSDVTLYARSVLLQGILAHDAIRWPAVEGFDRFDCALRLRTFAEKFQRESVADLCVGYARGLAWIDSIVLGCETAGQLHMNARLFSRPPLTSEQCRELEDALPRPPENFLNPSKWSISHEPTGVCAH